MFKYLKRADISVKKRKQKYLEPTGFYKGKKICQKQTSISMATYIQGVRHFTDFFLGWSNKIGGMILIQKRSCNFTYFATWYPDC